MSKDIKFKSTNINFTIEVSQTYKIVNIAKFALPHTFAVSSNNVSKCEIRWQWLLEDCI